MHVGVKDHGSLEEPDSVRLAKPIGGFASLIGAITELSRLATY